ncbi:MAG: HNH endonuclease [Gemmatimonadota bacterium]
MNAFVGVTDGDWFELLARQPGLEEANFWQPGGNRQFRVLRPGELFLFKLHSPRDFIVGGGFFAHSTLLPVSLAWEAFGIANGATTLAEMRSRIERYRRTRTNPLEDYTIGCILLEQPFFLPREQWIPVPRDWKRNIVQGRTYDLASGTGRNLWDALHPVLAGRRADVPQAMESPLRYGQPIMTMPRLGQGSFRVLVTDAYRRRCAVTAERTLPVLQAAHIQPYGSGGEHRIDNGLLLRSDLHVLFDRGYVTVTPDHRLEVSRRIREEFENGRDYYGLHGRVLQLPASAGHRPAEGLLRWHNERVYRG